MRPARILFRLKKKRSRTVKAFANVRDRKQPYPHQLHLCYFSLDENLEAVKANILGTLREKWPRKQKPSEIDWADAQTKLEKLRLSLALGDRHVSPAGTQEGYSPPAPHENVSL